MSPNDHKRQDAEAWEVESIRRLLGDFGGNDGRRKGARQFGVSKVEPFRRGAEKAKQAKVMAMMRKREEERKE